MGTSRDAKQTVIGDVVIGRTVTDPNLQFHVVMEAGALVQIV